MINFTTGTNKQIIGVAVTPNIGLEVMVIDKKTSRVQKYGHRPLEYNISTREISDYNAFKSALVEIYEELSIDTKSSIYLVLPNVHFGFISLSPIITDEAIETALLSKAEESYIFRRVEPKTAWADANFKNRTENRYLVYSSLQAPVVDKIKEMVTDMGGSVVGIEGSHCAFLRALSFADIEPNMSTPDFAWNVLLVSSNSYALFSLVGDKLVDYTEIPIAIKSFSHEEAYQAIAVSVAQVLTNYPAKKLLLVSQSDEISAEVLKTQITFEGDVQTLDCNKFTKIPPVETSPMITDKDAKLMSMSAIGAASYKIAKFPLTLNALATSGEAAGGGYEEIKLLGRTFVVTSETITKISLILSAIVAAFFALIYFGIVGVNKVYETKNLELNDNITKLDTELKSFEVPSTVSINSLINKIVTSNLQAMSFYDSLTLDIPKNVWLTYYYNKDGNLLTIKGMSRGIPEIYNYYKSLKVIAPNSTIKLTKLKLITNMFDDTYDITTVSDDIKLYSFEIGTDMPAPANATGTGTTADGAAQGDAGAAQGQGGNPGQPAQTTQSPGGGQQLDIGDQGNLEAPPSLEQLQ
jgi:proteasome lid subunit RPN8/RPN11